MNKYKSLMAWQSAHRFLVATYRTTDQHYHPRAKPVFDQLRRAALSIEANIVEGYALDTAPQFKRHLRIARASAAECEALLGIGAELHYLDNTLVGPLQADLETTLKTLHGLLKKPFHP